ncbi:MAG TPA: thioredoxin domain-containing protein [Anaerolineales bacterium]|nr:thioredoxin domain-containing protein [Anaerolineales bacterium]
MSTPNRLAEASSPYLLQHKDNPVDWYPWGEEALSKARREEKPIFLSIGYAACHWCHVMEHESFEDEETAALMNAHFVNIKVDREERPDLDAIYMQAVVAMTRHGGWPMSVFLTPEGEPFYGGTYFPPVRRHNMPAFKEILQSVAQTWEQDRAALQDQAGRLVDHLREALSVSGPQGDQTGFREPDLDQAAMRLAQAYDWKKGGWGNAPKFPQPMAIEFLMAKATRGDSFALEIATHALDAMAKGGMYDVVGGGFARYSVDDEWLVPHFEKMLYDNAQLVRAYLHAWLLTGKRRYREIVEETLDFIARELTGPEGGFYSSLDADSEGVEGKYYVWTPDDLAAALPDDGERAFVTAAYGISKTGNFEGDTVLQRELTDEKLAEQFNLDPKEVPTRLAKAHGKLLAHRERRVRPGTDDKCVVAWNGLMLVGFSEGARYLKNDQYKEMAMRNGAFLTEHARDPGTGRLARTWRQGRRGPDGFLDDYAALGLGLLALYQTDPDPKWFIAAQEIGDELIDRFSDPAGGFFDTGRDAEKLVVRPKDLQDNATPSGNSLAVQLLLQLAAYTGDGRYRDLAEQALSPIRPAALQYPTAFANWLCAADFAVGPVREVAIVGPDSAERDRLLAILHTTHRPRLVAATAETGEPPPTLLADRSPVDGAPAAYVCEHFVCLNPTTDPAELERLLTNPSNLS